MGVIGLLKRKRGDSEQSNLVEEQLENNRKPEEIILD